MISSVLMMMNIGQIVEVGISGTASGRPALVVEPVDRIRLSDLDAVPVSKARVEYEASLVSLPRLRDTLDQFHGDDAPEESRNTQEVQLRLIDRVRNITSRIEDAKMSARTLDEAKAENPIIGEILGHFFAGTLGVLIGVLLIAAVAAVLR